MPGNEGGYAALVAGFALLPISGLSARDTTMADDLLLDDFSRADGVSALGTRWEGFTDRVMGGRSDLQVGYRDSDAGPVLHMSGQVRLENRGGFIQARLPLAAGGGAIDASAWQGLRIKVRGAPGPYYLHLRTRQTWQPWQYFRAPIEVGPEWREQFVPFSAFEGRATWRSLDLRALKSVGVVAYGEAFAAEIEVARLALAARPSGPGYESEQVAKTAPPD
jgi:hypothetical protein